jgi:hypothetical protein
LKEDSGKKNRMEKSLDLVPGAFFLEVISSCSQDMKQRVIFFRSDHAIIPYCVEALNEDVKYEYETLFNSPSAKLNPHFDRQIFEDIRKTGFVLKPEDIDDEHHE